MILASFQFGVVWFPCFSNVYGFPLKFSVSLFLVRVIECPLESTSESTTCCLCSKRSTLVFGTLWFTHLYTSHTAHTHTHSQHVRVAVHTQARTTIAKTCIRAAHTHVYFLSVYWWCTRQRRDCLLGLACTCIGAHIHTYRHGPLTACAYFYFVVVVWFVSYFKDPQKIDYVQHEQKFLSSLVGLLKKIWL